MIRLKNRTTKKNLRHKKNDFVFSLLAFVEFYTLKHFIDIYLQKCKFMSLKFSIKYIQNGCQILHINVSNVLQKTTFEISKSYLVKYFHTTE